MIDAVGVDGGNAAVGLGRGDAVGVDGGNAAETGVHDAVGVDAGRICGRKSTVGVMLHAGLMDSSAAVGVDRRVPFGDPV